MYLYLYFWEPSSINIGMENTIAPAGSVFKSLFRQHLPTHIIHRIFERNGPARRRPPVLTPAQLIMSLTFHVVAGAGTLSQHVQQLMHLSLSDSALAQRRALIPWDVFKSLLAAVLRPKADPRRHPDAFYKGLRLCGIDGSLYSVANTPQVKAQMSKAQTRRGKAAFAKIGVAVMIELGLRNPIAAAIGPKEESEMVLAKQLLEALPEHSLLISDRYYGVPVLLIGLREIHPKGGRHFLVRVKSNLKSRRIETYADGSALVEIRAGQETMWVREIAGKVRRGKGGWSEVRLWTSLLDWRKHPASELLALYARRWEQESFYRELKVDMRSSPLLQSHTPQTAAQEIAAWIIAYAILVEERIKAAAVGEVGVLRISFLKTLEAVRGLWRFLETGEGLFTARQVRLLVGRTLRQIATMAIPKRRVRSCPRALRQPVSHWPRLLKNTYTHGAPQYKVATHKT